MPKLPVAFDISSEVFIFNLALALLCAATIRSSIIVLSSFSSLIKYRLLG